MLFRVEGFSLSGEGRYDGDEIVSASGIDIGDCLMWINLNKAEDRITKKLPYIETVTIKRKLPHTVSIEYKQAKVLYGVCREANPNSYSIEDAGELQFRWLEGCRSVGICGATSTPGWLMRRVAERVGEMVGTPEE